MVVVGAITVVVVLLLAVVVITVKVVVVVDASGKTNNAIDHYLSLYIAVGHYLCNNCNNHIMASIPYPFYL